MHVQVMGLVHICRHAQHIGPTSHIRKRCSRTFFEPVAQSTGENQLALSGQNRHFDLKDRTTPGSHGKALDQTDLGFE